MNVIEKMLKCGGAVRTSVGAEVPPYKDMFWADHSAPSWKIS